MNRSLSRYRAVIYVVIVASLLVPIIVFSGHLLAVLQLSESWKVITASMLWSIGGIFIVVMILRRWEELMRRAVAVLVNGKIDALFVDAEKKAASQSSEMALEDNDRDSAAAHEVLSLQKLIAEQKNVIECLREEVAAQDRDAALHIARESEKSLQCMSRYEEDLRLCREECDEQLAKRDALLAEYQHTIAEQRAIIEKKQKYLMKLENKVRDLTYEVKTLLSIGDGGGGAKRDTALKHPVFDVFQGKEYQQGVDGSLKSPLPISSDSEIHTPYDASILLQRCLSSAEKLTGAQRFATTGGHTLGLSSESYALDLRRLCDTFRNEHAAVIMLFSSEDNRMLFINNQIRGLLGWSSERASKEFFSLMRKGERGWQDALAAIARNENQKGQHIRLLMKMKTGEDLLVRCTLGRISQGVFSGHIIGIMYHA